MIAMTAYDDDSTWIQRHALLLFVVCVVVGLAVAAVPALSRLHDALAVLR